VDTIGPLCSSDFEITWCRWKTLFLFINLSLSYFNSKRYLVKTLVQNIWFFSPLVLSNWEIPQLSQFVYFLRKFFNFRIIKCTLMLYYALFDVIVHFIIKKSKNKHTFLKKYTNWESWGISWREIPQLSQFIYFLRKMCLFFNFLMMKFKVMFCLT
jgi:hypothetical protein